MRCWAFWPSVAACYSWRRWRGACLNSCADSTRALRNSAKRPVKTVNLTPFASLLLTVSVYIALDYEYHACRFLWRMGNRADFCCRFALVRLQEAAGIGPRFGTGHQGI